MSCDFISLAKPQIQALQPYQPGKPVEELQRELGLSEVVKLASNENPLGLSQKVKAAIADNLDQLTLYPDGAGFYLKQALAKRFNVADESITIGNGSNDVLNLIGLSYIDQNSSVIFSEHAFIVYPLMTQYLGAKAICTKAKDYGHDLDAMLAAIEDDTKVIFIANPNNPTGTWLGQEALEQFLAKVPEYIIVVLDEAYSEYIDTENSSVNYANGLALQKKFTNLVLVRTFSKAYGLAGLRVGFCISHPDVANVLNRVREPFNVNSLAQLAAITVLDDAEYLSKSIAVNNAGRAQLEAGLAKLGYEFIASQGNFITFDTRTDALPVYQQLLQQGVIVRPIAGYGLPQHLRVSIGLEHENAAFLKALEQVQ